MDLGLIVLEVCLRRIWSLYGILDVKRVVIDQ